MKTPKSTFSAGLAVGTALLCLAGIFAHAQFGGGPATTTITPPGARPGAGAANVDGMIRVSNNGLTDLGKDFAQRAPNVGNRSGGRAKTWGVFDVTFDTAPEWIDDMSITYFLMLENDKAKQGEKRMSLFTATFEYADIPGGAMGRDHKAGVVLPPNTLLRYGKPIGFAVQFSVGGQSAGDGYGTATGSLRGQDKWWINNNVIGSEAVQKRTGLIERSKSVFSVADPDSYEVAK
ncbi:MAG: hypothetical protein FWG05_04935 [Kiritimatiellaeota bacterium]|nr:hypothetical protein [Kiritimatiellota bacterium]